MYMNHQLGILHRLNNASAQSMFKTFTTFNIIIYKDLKNVPLDRSNTYMSEVYIRIGGLRN